MSNLVIAYGCLIVLVVTGVIVARDLRDTGADRWGYVALAVALFPVGVPVWLINRGRLRREAQPPSRSEQGSGSSL